MAITKALILAIISLAIISYLPVLRELLIFPEKVRIEDISHYENRFESAKRMLPPHGVIKYLSDCSDMSNINCIAGFYIAQYALSPLVLDRSSLQRLLLGNFHSADAVQENRNNARMKRLLDSGNGVIIYCMDEK